VRIALFKNYFDLKKIKFDALIDSPKSKKKKNLKN
jgi:hypothetical protein